MNGIMNITKRDLHARRRLANARGKNMCWARWDCVDPVMVMIFAKIFAVIFAKIFELAAAGCMLTDLINTRCVESCIWFRNAGRPLFSFESHRC